MEKTKVEEASQNWRIEKAKVNAKKAGCELVDYDLYKSNYVNELIYALITLFLWLIFGFGLGVAWVMANLGLL